MGDKANYQKHEEWGVFREEVTVQLYTTDEATFDQTNKFVSALLSKNQEKPGDYYNRVINKKLELYIDDAKVLASSRLIIIQAVSDYESY